MKKQLFFISLLLLFLLSIPTFSSCDYITGKALDKTAETVSLPGWVWGLAANTYPSTVIDRYTHQPITDVSPEEAFGIIGTSQYLGNPIVIDVRTPQEYADGHLWQAINIDYSSSTFKEEINKYERHFTYIVYCRSGSRSAKAQKIMVELGFKYVINMTGGYMEWVAEGFPVAK